MFQLYKQIKFNFSVPADGVKGKTWGPSSGGYVLNSMASTGSTTSQSSKSRPSIHEDSRWSKSNTSLEKSPFSKPGLHTVTSVPEIGK